MILTGMLEIFVIMYYVGHLLRDLLSVVMVKLCKSRTGQILGADVMLEYVYFTNRVKYEKIYDTFASNNLPSEEFQCLAGNHIQQGNMFGMMVMGDISNYSNLEQHRIIYESLVKLTLHVVGHTLGLSHNFYSSKLHSFKNIHYRHITEPVGLTSSVMDYVSANIGVGQKTTGSFTQQLRPYDIGL